MRTPAMSDSKQRKAKRQSKTRTAHTENSHAAKVLNSVNQEVSTAFEILVAYVVDIYYNHVYDSAKKTAASGLTGDEYRRAADTYLYGVKNDRTYFEQTLLDIHKNFTRYYQLSYVAFVDKIVSYFVPADHFRLADTSIKDEILHNVLCELFVEICVATTASKMLVKVLGPNRGDKSAREIDQRDLQNQGMLFLLTKRTDLHNQFLRKKSNRLEGMISVTAVDELKKVIRRLAKEKTQVQAELNLERQKNSSLEQRLRKLIQISKAYRTKMEVGPDRLAEVEPRQAPAAPPPRERIAENAPEKAPTLPPPRERIAENAPEKAPMLPPPRERIAESKETQLLVPSALKPMSRPPALQLPENFDDGDEDEDEDEGDVLDGFIVSGDKQNDETDDAPVHTL